jgi:hypothetical protein
MMSLKKTGTIIAILNSNRMNGRASRREGKYGHAVHKIMKERRRWVNQKK